MRALVMLGVLVVCVVSARKATLAGDGAEYFSMLESFWNHGTPEQRPGDAASLASLFAHHGLFAGRPHDGFFVTSSGRWFSYHFWIYPLLAVPAKAALRLFGADEFHALSATNAALLVATLAWALRGRAAPSAARVALLALATVGPVLWYVQWPHGEVFAWCCVVMSLVALDEQRHARAATFAALGALHAPPIALLAALSVALAALDPAPRRLRLRLRRVGLALAGASLMAASPLFYFAAFGVTNLIVANGFADPGLVSVRRVLSLAFDLDQGMLPFVPAALLLGLAGLLRALLARRWRALAVALTAIAMLAASSQTTNFNAGCAGMNRYDVWVMPLFAWLAAHELPWDGPLRSWRTAARGSWRIAALAAVSALAVTQAALTYNGGARDDAHEHHPLARFLLRHAPSLYTAEPESFAERTLGRSLDPAWYGMPGPIAFVGRYGGVTKLLLDREGLEQLPERFDVDSGWLDEARAASRHERGLFFLDPPCGAVRRLGSEGHLEFADGWYGAEALGTDRWRWMADRASVVVRAVRGAAGVVRIAGWVPEALARAPVLTVSLDGAVIDRFEAPRQRFTRDYPLAAPRANARVTIETSDVARPRGDDRSLGFALLRAELADSPGELGNPYARFVGAAWGEPFGEREARSRCLTRRAEIALAPIPGARRATLFLGIWVPSNELARPADVRVSIDGQLVERGPVHTQARRRIPLRADVGHVVTIEPDVALDTSFGHLAACVDVLRYLAE